MELLIPAVVTVLTELFKKLCSRFAPELVKAVTLLVVFVFSVATVALHSFIMGELVSFTDFDQILKIFATAIGYHQIFVKRIIDPAFNKK